MDIAQLEEIGEATYEVVVATTSTGDDVSFTVKGTASEAYRKALRAAEVYGIKSAAQRKKLTDMTTDDGAQIAADNTERVRQIMLEHCVVGWKGFTVNGEPAELNVENLRRVFKLRPAWAERVLREIETDTNFTQG